MTRRRTPLPTIGCVRLRARAVTDNKASISSPPFVRTPCLVCAGKRLQGAAPQHILRFERSGQTLCQGSPGTWGVPVQAASQLEWRRNAVLSSLTQDTGVGTQLSCVSSALHCRPVRPRATQIDTRNSSSERCARPVNPSGHRDRSMRAVRCDGGNAALRWASSRRAVRCPARTSWRLTAHQTRSRPSG